MPHAFQVLSWVKIYRPTFSGFLVVRFFFFSFFFSAHVALFGICFYFSGVNTVTGHSAFPPTSSGTFETSITRRSHSNATCVTDALGSRPTWTDILRNTNTRMFQVANGIAGCFCWGARGRRHRALISLVTWGSLHAKHCFFMLSITR